MRDEKSHPAWARVPILVALNVFVLWLLGGFVLALANFDALELPHAIEARRAWFHLVRFRMFTDSRPYHYDLRVFVIADEGTKEVDIGTMFPTSFHEGPGWAREQFRKDQNLLIELAAAVCNRSEEPTGVRIEQLRWNKTLGQLEQPWVDIEVKELGAWSCEGA